MPLSNKTKWILGTAAAVVVVGSVGYSQYLIDSDPSFRAAMQAVEAEAERQKTVLLDKCAPGYHFGQSYGCSVLAPLKSGKGRWALVLGVTEEPGWLRVPLHVSLTPDAIDGYEWTFQDLPDTTLDITEIDANAAVGPNDLQYRQAVLAWSKQPPE